MDHTPGHKERRGERSVVTGVVCYEHFVKENLSAWLFDFGKSRQMWHILLVAICRDLPSDMMGFCQVLLILVDSCENIFQLLWDFQPFVWKIILNRYKIGLFIV